MRAIDLKPREQYFFIKAFSLWHFEKIFRCSRCHNFTMEGRAISYNDTRSFIDGKGQWSITEKKLRYHRIANYDDDDRCKESFDLSSEEKVCNDVALSGFVLSYFVSARAAFVHSCLPILLRIGSDYQPRWGALSREMRVSIAPNRRRNGIGGNDERCNTGFVRSHVLFPFPYPRSPHLSFSWFNIRSGRPPSFLFGAERFRARIGFSCGRLAKRDASKRFNLSSFRAKTF